VALIGAPQIISEWGMVNAQTPDVLGYPDANVFLYQGFHKEASDDFEKLKEIVEHTEVNSNMTPYGKEGFKRPVVGGYYTDNRGIYNHCLSDVGEFINVTFTEILIITEKIIRHSTK